MNTQTYILTEWNEFHSGSKSVKQPAALDIVRVAYYQKEFPYCLIDMH